MRWVIGVEGGIFYFHEGEAGFGRSRVRHEARQGTQRTKKTKRTKVTQRERSFSVTRSHAGAWERGDEGVPTQERGSEGQRERGSEGHSSLITHHSSPGHRVSVRGSRGFCIAGSPVFSEARRF